MPVPAGPQRRHRDMALARLLEERRRVIEAEVRGIVERPQRDTTVPMDIEDQAVDDLLQHVDLALAEMRSLTLRNIEAAIRRLQQGTFGACTDCGMDIPEARRRARPYARLCQPCQAGREREQHRGGPAEAPGVKR